MKLYLLSQIVNQDWDTFDSCVVAAENEEAAVLIHPGEGVLPCERFCSWAYKVEDVRCEYIGEAKEGTKSGVICASFNAG